MIVIVHQNDTSVTQGGKCTFWTEIMILESWCPHNKCCPVLEWKSFYLNLSDNTNTGCKTLGFVLSFCLLYHTLSYQSHHALSYHLYQTLSYHVIPYQDTQHTSYGISIRIHFISICVYWNQFITHNWIVRKEWQTLPQILFQRVFAKLFWQVSYSVCIPICIHPAPKFSSPSHMNGR